MSLGTQAKKLVTVLMPVQAKTAQDPRLQQWFKAALNSLLSQTYSDLEIILIGDAERRIERWIPARFARHSNIHLIARERQGLVGALNTGVKAATGEMIARMDADDLCAPDRIQRQVELLLDHPQVTFCGTGIEIFSESGHITDGSHRYQNWLNAQNSPTAIGNSVFIECPLPHPSWMLRRELYEQLNGYREVEWAEDYDFLLRAWMAGAVMAKPGFDLQQSANTSTTEQLKEETPVQSNTLVYWRDHDLRLTRNDSHYSRANFIRAKAWALSQSLLKNRSAIILGTGTNAKRLHDSLQHYNVSVSCFVEMNIAHTKKTIRQLPVINYEELFASYKQDELIVNAVTRYGARAQLRQWFDEQNIIESDHYIFAG